MAGQPDKIFSRITAFIRSTGIDISQCPLRSEDCFLPGIAINQGRVEYDQDLLLYPGDLLHEAGHIAVVPLAERATLNKDSLALRPQHAAEEMMAIAWSYAACCHLDLDPEIVFHEAGYSGGGENILQSFKSSCPIGVPMLQYMGMAYYMPQAAQPGHDPYPAMIRWALP